MKKKLIRITTVPISLDKLLEGQLCFMNDYFQVTAISSNKDYLDKIAIKEKVNVFHLEMTRQITPIKDIVAVVKLFFFLRREQPLIVHSHTPKAGIVAMLASKLAGIPYRLHTVAGLPLLEVNGFKRKILNFVEKFTYSCSTKVYPNSFALKSIIIENKFCSESKLKVIGNGSSNGINSSYFDKSILPIEKLTTLKKDLKINEGDFIFIFVGRLVADKGINELINAFKRISQTNKNCKLLLVGSQEEKLDPLNKETLLEINNNQLIISVGYQEDVRPFFAIASCLVFPSYREGFPNVVLQAGAMGLPSIVTDINGCNEIIEHNNNGLIIQPKSSNELFHSMIQLVQDEVLYNTLKSNAREMIISRFEQNFLWHKLLEEYSTFE